MEDGKHNAPGVAAIWPSIELFAYPQMPWMEEAADWGHAFGRASLAATPAQGDSTNGQGPEGSPRSHGNGSTGAHAGVAANPEREARPEAEAAWVARAAEESRRAEERGRREGLEVGLVRGREEAARSLASERDCLVTQAVALADSFAEERSQYFHRVEQEAVGLALAVAARILRREAQMDPLLLSGAVRVALGQLAQSTTVRLHVPMRDQALWQEALARIPNLGQRPQVVGEGEMELGACRMETELGAADLSLWAQLKEIERGFFDRVGGRGGVKEAAEHEAMEGGARAGSVSPERESAREPERDREPAAVMVQASGTATQSTAGAGAGRGSAEDPTDGAGAAFAEREW